MNYLECTRPTPHFITSPSPLGAYIYYIYTQNAIMVIEFFGWGSYKEKLEENYHVFRYPTNISATGRNEAVQSEN